MWTLRTAGGFTRTFLERLALARARPACSRRRRRRELVAGARVRGGGQRAARARRGATHVVGEAGFAHARACDAGRGRGAVPSRGWARRGEGPARLVRRHVEVCPVCAIEL